jgi:hypothetical protein
LAAEPGCQHDFQMNIPSTEHANPVKVAGRRIVVPLASFVLLTGCAVAADKPAPEKQDASRQRASTGPTNQAAWKSLFDGKTLAGWKATDFAGRGEVSVKDGRIILESGSMTGITWTNAGDLPRINYELSLEAMRVEGGDFFCGLTFPVDKDPCSLIVGGWGGGVIGLSSLDSQDAANNETTRYMTFQNGRWYRIRLRVTTERIEAWVDQDKVVDVATADKAISIRMEMEESKPLGVASWSTTAALRNLQVRRLQP